MTEQVIRCEDDTCVHNINGKCSAKEIIMELEQDKNYQEIVACKTYSDRRELE